MLVHDLGLKVVAEGIETLLLVQAWLLSSSVSVK
jgi:sensor c-di-GMP phosphodiesterase-like protein